MLGYLGTDDKELAVIRDRAERLCIYRGGKIVSIKDVEGAVLVVGEEFMPDAHGAIL